jgi:hypothetical protein
MLRFFMVLTMMFLGSITYGVTPALSAQEAFRPPAVPLVTHDPYFSVWSNADQLPNAPTRHWTGKEQALSSLIRTDGKSYRLMGATPAALPALQQTDLQVLPTRTIYTFTGAGVQVRLVFTSPLLPDDLDLLSRPVTYVTWEVVSNDGQTHDAALYFDASAALAVNNPDQQVVWSREEVGDLTALKIGSESQPVLQKAGDDLRIDWGYLYLAADQYNVPKLAVSNINAFAGPLIRRGTTAESAIGDNDALESTFATQGTLPTTDDNRQPRAVSDGEPVAALAFPLGRVGAQPVSRYAMLAYDDLYSIQFMFRNLRPYWRRNGANAAALLGAAEREYSEIQKRCSAFDTELMSDLNRAGGEKYAQLAALAYRQALAAQKVVADSNGQPLSFSKENYSNGCIATVDVIYPAAPQMIALSPSLLKASLQPIMLYAASKYWKFPFAPHDLGTYPKANGQVYGGGENNEGSQMPVEESGNLLLLLAALAKTEGNTKFSDPFWPQITQWADYLAQKGFDPESQLSTDDFAGHLAHNINLSAKAIVALGAYAQMAQMRGETATAQKYRGLAEKFAAQWVAAAGDGDHTRLAFDKPGTWSQKYNLVWDSILGLKLFPQTVYDREMAFYRSKLNAYGLPLDSRRDYTKLDWQIWTATLTGRRDDFEALMSPIYDWMNATPSRVPMTDWYDTKTGRMEAFQARSVVGGVFIPLLKDPALWTKWGTRDRNRPANWAPMPLRPVYQEIVPTAQTRIIWKYTLENPGADWFAPNFDDSTWQYGEAGFGSNNTPSIVVRTPWTSKDIWLRRTFEIEGNPPANLWIYGFHDEDAEIYLNGTLVGTVGGYSVKYQSLLPIPAGLLKSGQNLLAVHCHQETGGQGIDIGIARQQN